MRRTVSLAAMCVVASVVFVCVLVGCRRKQASVGRVPTKAATRLPLDVYPILQDQRWAWGAGAPTILQRGQFTADTREDVLVVTEPIPRRGQLWQHFFVLRGPALSPQALFPAKILINPKLRGFRWGQKTLRVTSAVVADVNGDGATDVVVSYNVGRIALFLCVPKQKAFRLHRVLTSEGHGMMAGVRVQVGDWTGDGKLDIAAVSSASHVLLWEQTPGLSFVPWLVAGQQALLPRRRPGKWLRVWPAASKRPTTKPATTRAVFRRGLLRVDGMLELPHWLSSRGLMAVDADRNGVLDLVLLGNDDAGRSRFWLLYGTRNKRVSRRKWGFSLGSGGMVTGQWPKDAPVRGPVVLPVSWQKYPSLVTVTSLFAPLNLRGVALLDQLTWLPRRKRWTLHHDGEAKRAMMWESALSFGLVAGQFGRQRQRGVVWYSPYRVMGYAPDKRMFRFDLRRDALIQGRLSLRAVVGCRLADDGADALVMLSIGSLDPKAPLGNHILIYRKPLF